MITLDEMKKILANVGVDVQSIDFDLLTEIANEYGYDYDVVTRTFNSNQTPGTYTLDEVKDQLRNAGYALDDFEDIDDIISFATDLNYYTKDGITFTLD